jgi:hypothetical protein
MLLHDTTREQIEYRVVLVRSGSHAIWVQSDGGALRLPRVTIPRWTRPAEQLQQILEDVWHLRTIVLDVLPGKTDSTPCVVMEILPPGSCNGFAAATSEDITEQEMTSDEREAVKGYSGLATSMLVGRSPASAGYRKRCGGCVLNSVTKSHSLKMFVNTMQQAALHWSAFAARRRSRILAQGNRQTQCS